MNSSAPARAGTRQWLGLAVLALPTLLVAMDVSVLHLAVPQISSGLGASAQEMLWIVDIYGFMIAGFLVTMGTLGDRIGRRKILLFGAAAFAAASVLAAYADDPVTLIAARALLGITGATLMPSTLSLIVNMFGDERQRGLAIAVWVTMFSVGTALGPVIGGLILQAFWWGAVFLIAVPIMVLLLAVGPVLLPEYRDPDGGKLDLVSVALSLVAILPIILGLKELATDGSPALAAAAIVVGAAFGYLFVRRQRTSPNPLVDVRLFSRRAFTVAASALLLTMFVAGGTYLFITQFLQLVAGRSPLTAGLWLLPAAFTLIITSMSAPGLAGRFGPAPVVAAGLAVSGVGHLLLLLVTPSQDVGLLVTAFAILYAGGGPVVALGTDLIVGSAPPQMAGSASAVSETSTELGMALGVAALGSLGTGLYRAQVTVPPGTPPATAEAIQDSLANGVAATTSLPPSTADTLLASAREAFTSGLAGIALTSAILSFALAGLVLWGIRPSEEVAEEASATPVPEAA
ncbi:MFS transporter [Actinokineospora cianjurensis]|uniref:DHA2 family multidrug resistance protein-like MFS transporter n=1 Tax=Actinokineospora cianjurensis TaxID=585224 RepID=A0A421B0Z6_9PSEU|nr:MFS transporter [Actinokineospora cianjurensis]RLK57956.1 DHA2 family multidrug resistance protein-like MFS transporter [Actinokineospora cianjurensis]